MNNLINLKQWATDRAVNLEKISGIELEFGLYWSTKNNCWALAGFDLEANQYLIGLSKKEAIEKAKIIDRQLRNERARNTPGRRV